LTNLGHGSKWEPFNSTSWPAQIHALELQVLELGACEGASKIAIIQAAFIELEHFNLLARLKKEQHVRRTQIVDKVQSNLAERVCTYSIRHAVDEPNKGKLWILCCRISRILDLATAAVLDHSPKKGRIKGSESQEGVDREERDDLLCVAVDVTAGVHDISKDPLKNFGNESIKHSETGNKRPCCNNVAAMIIEIA
jgi:hypothetical protein